MLKQFIPTVIFIFLTVSLTVAQDIDDWIIANEKNPVEKIYVHTDSENYFTGDTVYLKVYLTDSRSGQLIPRAENVYFKLTDEMGNQAIQLVLLCVNGQALGSFVITEKFKPGNYLAQAYTNYLFNFGPDSYFYKQVSISRISPSVQTMPQSNREVNMVADVGFFPEGGILLENVTNLVAFKAIGKLGYGVNAKGTVKDEKGVVVATYSTDYKGMGLFFLTPAPGKTYTAFVDGFPSFKYIFKPVNDGVKIQLVNHTSKEVIVNIAGNTESITGELFYLVNMSRGEVLFYQAFKMDGLNKVFKFENNSLKQGINKLVLLDKSLKPVSERLLFSRKLDVNNLVIQSDNEVYNKRSVIKLQINDEKYLTEMDFSNLSVSVVNELTISVTDFSKNILSHFLIDSEINGFVESSGDLFADNEISSEAKLRLVMLTNGYRSYFWNTAPNKTTELRYKQQAGIDLSGIANNSLTGSVIANGEITLAIQKDDEVAFVTQKTDENGHFTFPGLLFSDTAAIHVQAKNETGKMNTDVILEPVFRNSGAAESHFKLLKEKTQNNSQLAGLKYLAYSENKKQQPKAAKSRNKKSGQNGDESDGHFRLYESADYVLELSSAEQSYDNVLDYMVGKVPGLDINGDEIRIRGTSSFGTNSIPLFMLDGVPLVGSQTFNLPDEVSQSVDNEGMMISNTNEQLIQTVRAIPLNDIDKIEVLKSAQNLAVFGVKGANGVIAIYTKRGEKGQGSSIGKGVIAKSIVGYSKYREFYSPKYTPENESDKQSDIRTLLYWNPKVITKNGSAELEFYSSDQPGTYKIIAEGINSNGRICIGQGLLKIK